METNPQPSSIRNETPKFIKPSSEKRGKRTNQSLHHNASILDRNTEKRLTANRALWAALPPQHCPSLILTFRCAICIIGFYYFEGGLPSSPFSLRLPDLFIFFQRFIIRLMILILLLESCLL